MDLGDALAQTLPLAVGVALSPFPAIALLLILTSAHGRVSGPVFAVGRLAGLAIVLGIVFLASDAIYSLSSAASLPAVVRMLLGAALIVLAFVRWRPSPAGVEPTLPAWMSAIRDARGVRAFGFGVLITVANLKELVLLLSIGITLGGDQLSTSAAVWASVIAVLVGWLPVGVAVVAYVVAPIRMRPAVEAASVWLTANSYIVIGTILLVIGAAIIGGAISEL